MAGGAESPRHIKTIVQAPPGGIKGRNVALIYRPNHPQASENGMIDRALVEPEASDPHFYVISDTMDALRHMATGRMHTSKAAFRADTKASGCVEIGNDSSLGKPRKPIQLSREQRRNDIRRTVYELRNGRS